LKSTTSVATVIGFTARSGDHTRICRSANVRPRSALAPFKGRAAIHHVRRLDPNLRISNVEDWVVLRRPEDLATFVEGLRKAGLPE